MATPPMAAASADAMADPRPIYPLADTAELVQAVQLQFQRVQAPLARFPASWSRLRPALAEEVAEEPPPGQRLPLAPLSQAGLVQLVRARLEPGRRGPQVPAAVQAVFREVILAEVRRVWKDVHLSLFDPGCSLRANRLLYQRLVTYVGVACQEIFQHYLRLADRGHRLDVFTDSANLARFSTQLALACAGLLNVAAVRHRLLTEMKALHFHPPSRKQEQPVYRLGLSMSRFIQLMRPRVLTMRERLALEVRELQELPGLDLSKIRHFILPAPRPFWKEMTCAAVTTPCPQLTASASKLKQGQAQQAAATHIRRTQSLPIMRVGQLLADELGIRLSLRPLSPHLPTHYAEAVESEEEGDLKRMRAIAEDLRRLVQGPVLKSSPWKGDLDEESELPPLIKALTLRKTNEIRYQQLKRMLHSLQQEEASAQKQRQTLICAPASHPQAATVNFDVHGKMVVKAADLQVSERAYLDTVSMERCPAVYNHLLGDIDMATVKALDSELFAGEEVREIYKELMDTVPKDHLTFDLGSLSEHAVASLDRDLCFASTTLTRKKGEQVINEELSRILPAGPFDFDNVTDTIKTPHLPFKKKATKTQYVSWLKWWKATFNTDNFLKFVGNKEMDYLPVIFHLYSCEEEEEKEMVLDEAEIKRQVQVKKAAIKRAAQLQEKAERHQSGEWEWGASTVGGEAGAATPGETPAVTGPVFDPTMTGPASLPFDHKPEELRMLQRRLERLWTVLHFSERERLDMAIKYSSSNYYYLLPDMLHSWESAAQAIQEREVLLAELEKFELTASDPNRFFRKIRKSFRMRLSESRVRGQLYFVLAQYNSELQTILTHIQEMFNDVVTFKGRPYMKKMEWDVVEMLYWLQQGRRASVLRKEVHRGQLLPPVASRPHCTEQHRGSELETHTFYEEMSSSFLDLQGSAFSMGTEGEEPGRRSSSFEVP